jgi:hypothetical protein
VPLLEAFKPQEQALKVVLPRQGPLDTHPQGMDRFINEPLAPALDALAVAWVLFDGGEHARTLNMHVRCALEAKPPSRLP